MCPTPDDPRRELQQAWNQVSKQLDRLGTDRALAELSLQLIRQLGNLREHQPALRRIAEAWDQDVALTLHASALLIEQAAGRAMDAPLLSEDSPSFWAATSLERCLRSAGLSREQRGALAASLGNALRMCGPARDAEAIEAFEQALATDPNHGSWWFDFGLLHKWRGRFQEGLQVTQKAHGLLGDQKSVLWNIAICATGSGEGQTASEAWRRIGVAAELDPKSSMPYVPGLPPLMVRVLSRGSGTETAASLPGQAVGFELLWVAPLSPCHGVVQSPAFRDAPIDYGDVVLWDGAPVASHIGGDGQTSPVFPILEILRRGTERRWSFVGLEREPGAADGLQAELPEGTRLFIQQERVQHHCEACARGEAHAHQDPPVQPRQGLVRGKVIVPAEQDLQLFQEAWERALRQRPMAAAMIGLYEALGHSKRAGQEHQAWAGIERKAARLRGGQ